MLFRLLKKVTKNYGVFLALFLGIILSLVTINSTVIYGNSLKDSLFQLKLKNYAEKNQETPGTIMVEKFNLDPSLAMSETFRETIKSEIDGMNMEIEEGRVELQAQRSVYWYGENDPIERIAGSEGYILKSTIDFQNHINILQGRLFNDSFIQENQNIVEVMVDVKTFKKRRLQMDKLYRMELVDKVNVNDIMFKTKESIKEGINLNYFKIVGIYEYKNNDTFWRKGFRLNNTDVFMVNEKSLSALCEKEKKSIYLSSEYFIDFSAFRYYTFSDFMMKKENVQKGMEMKGFRVTSNVENIIGSEHKNFKLLNNMLWIIQIPVLTLLFLYILMITGIIVDRDKDNIALLKSRGASKWKIINNYLFDGIVILGIGLVITPFLSLLSAKWMSTTSGFMEFNGEFAQNIYMFKDNFYYSIVTGMVFLGALLIPVIKAAGEGIVDRKKSKVRIKFSTWKKTFIDFILIGIGFYGLKTFLNSQNLIQDLDVNINSITIDPLIFMSATILSFGLSLFFLRVYPLFIRIILKIFKRIMPAHILVLFSNLSRKAGKREYTMLFIMVLISSSIFNLKIARTINTNVVENIKYTAGAEIRMKGFWNSAAGEEIDKLKQEMGAMGYVPDDLVNTELIEPDYNQFQELESFESISKVITINNVRLRHGTLTINSADIMGVEPKQFGETAFMRKDLTPVHWYRYLNILAEHPKVVFLSSNVKEQYRNQLEIGQTINIEVYGFDESFVFGGYIDYWPSYTRRRRTLIVGNFDWIYSRVARVPYEVWGKLKEDKNESDFLREIREKSVGISEMSSISEITKENVFLKAINSSITISFILSMIVTLLGFLIYWCICIRERELQFGILRSLGVKIGKIYSMIFIEQILVTGASLLVGVGIGQYVSEKFLKLVTEIIFGNTLVLPIIQYITSSDYLLIVVIFIISVIIVLVMILKYIADIKLSQAVKIGED